MYPLFPGMVTAIHMWRRSHFLNFQQLNELVPLLPPHRLLLPPHRLLLSQLLLRPQLRPLLLVPLASRLLLRRSEMHSLQRHACSQLYRRLHMLSTPHRPLPVLH